jgi:hypothetical protein
MGDHASTGRTTPPAAIRVPRTMWAAYGRVCGRLGSDRTEDLLEHMRQRIAEHGDTADLADLGAAEAELAERRSRKGGRPRKAR